MKKYGNLIEKTDNRSSFTLFSTVIFLIIVMETLIWGVLVKEENPCFNEKRRITDRTKH